MVAKNGLAWLQTNNKRMAVPLRCTQILLRFTAQNFAMRKALAAMLEPLLRIGA
jgi:hypothetical protein